MAVHRFWRLSGFELAGTGALELTELRLYQAATLCDSAVLPTCAFTPDIGTVSYLQDNLTTGVTSWSKQKWSRAAFSLKWDFASAPVNISNIRLGSSSSSETFPNSLTLEFSDDGDYWIVSQYVYQIKFPGANTLTSEPVAVATGSNDPNYSMVTLLLNGDGENGSTVFTDSSIGARVVNTVGSPTISNLRYKFGDSAVRFPSSNDYLSLSDYSAFSFGTGDFTLEAWVFLTSFATAARPFFIGEASVGIVQVYITTSGILGVETSDSQGSANGQLALNNWHHIAVARSSGTVRLFLDGLVQHSYSDARSLNVPTTVFIGQYGGGGYGFTDGSMDDIRVTKGFARYTLNFVPPGALASPYGIFLPTLNNAPVSYRNLQLASQRFGSIMLGNTKVNSDPAVKSLFFADIEHGGVGKILGTVKENAANVHVPLRRKVFLIDEANQIVIRKTWSDALTGEYVFSGVKTNRTYTVVAYDYFKNYRAVIADGLLPQAMP